MIDEAKSEVDPRDTRLCWKAESLFLVGRFRLVEVEIEPFKVLDAAT